MTTIAVSKKHNMMSCDGRQVTNKILGDKKDKLCRFINKENEFIAGFAGDSNALESFQEEINKTESIADALINTKSKDWSCLIYLEDEIYLSSSKARAMAKLEVEHWAIGSGEEWAISAMDFGKTPKEAVKYAMTRDYYTGGKIFTEKLKGETK